MMKVTIELINLQSPDFQRICREPLSEQWEPVNLYYWPIKDKEHSWVNAWSMRISTKPLFYSNHHASKYTPRIKLENLEHLSEI